MRAAEFIEYARILAGDEHGDVHTDTKMLAHLNRVCRDISMRSRSVTESMAVPARAGQALYGLPSGFLRADIVAWQYGQQYKPLEPITMRIASWSVHNEITGRPRRYDIYGKAAVERAVEFVTVAEVPMLPRGGVDNEATQSTFAVSGPQNLVVKPGDKVVNMSDGSSFGFIRSVDSSDPDIQVFTYTPLEQGRRRWLQVGDEIRILSPDVSQHSLVVSPVPVDAGDVGHEALFLYVARVHRQITADNIADENDYLDLDMEFEQAVIEYLVYWMRRDELGVRDNETQAQHITARTAYEDALPDVRTRIRQWMSLWHKRQGVEERPLYAPGSPAALESPRTDLPVGAVSRDTTPTTETPHPVVPTADEMSVVITLQDVAEESRFIHWNVAFDGYPVPRRLVANDFIIEASAGEWQVVNIATPGAQRETEVLTILALGDAPISGSIRVGMREREIGGRTIIGNRFSERIAFNFAVPGDRRGPEPTTREGRYPRRVASGWDSDVWDTFMWG